jgi:hypothetical protein
MAFAQGEYAYGLSISIETLTNSMKTFMLSDNFKPLEGWKLLDEILTNANYINCKNISTIIILCILS